MRLPVIKSINRRYPPLFTNPSKMFQLTKEITTEKVFKSCESTKEFVLGMLAVTTTIANEHLNPGAIVCCLDLIRSFFKQFSYLKKEF